MTHISDSQLISYQLNELSLQEAEFITNHISNCQTCQEQLELMNMLTDEWEEPSIVEIPSPLEDSIMNMIESSKHIQHQRPKPYMKYVHFTMAAAATFIFFKANVTGILLGTSKQLTETYDHTIQQTNNLSISEWITSFTNKEE
jgi:hypothetical protein